MIINLGILLDGSDIKKCQSAVLHKAMTCELGRMVQHDDF